MKTAKKHLDENKACTAVPVRKGTVPARCRKRYPFPYENQLILYLEHFHPKNKNGKQQKRVRNSTKKVKRKIIKDRKTIMKPKIRSRPRLFPEVTRLRFAGTISLSYDTWYVGTLLEGPVIISASFGPSLKTITCA